MKIKSTLNYNVWIRSRRLCGRSCHNRKLVTKAIHYYIYCFYYTYNNIITFILFVLILFHIFLSFRESEWVLHECVAGTSYNSSYPWYWFIDKYYGSDCVSLPIQHPLARLGVTVKAISNEIKYNMRKLWNMILVHLCFLLPTIVFFLLLLYFHIWLIH